MVGAGGPKSQGSQGESCGRQSEEGVKTWSPTQCKYVQQHSEIIAASKHAERTASAVKTGPLARLCENMTARSYCIILELTHSTLLHKPRMYEP